MRLRTDPIRFSITAFLADQVTLVERSEGLSPGAALLRLQHLSRDAEGRARLLDMFKDAARRECDPVEARKIAAIQAQFLEWMRHEAEAPCVAPAMAAE